MKSILILEDESQIAARLRTTLELRGYAVRWVATADEAFRQVEREGAYPDLLIADVHIPFGPSGIRVALKLRSVIPSLQIILTSGFPPGLWDDNDSADVNELPSDSVAILRKPFQAVDLLEVVERLIGPPLWVALR